MKPVSATQIKTYLECRQHYYDRYILKKPQNKSTASLLGTALHEAIEKYYTRGEPVIGTFNKCVRNTLNRWQDNGDNVDYFYTHAEIMDIGLDILRNFNYGEYKCKYSEMSFNLPFYDITRVSGVIDMITADGRLIDFKSAKRAPKKEYLNKDPQFLLYPWVHFQLFGQWPTSVIWHHLRTGEQIEFEFDWKNFDDIVVCTVRDMIKDTFADLAHESCDKCVPWCYRYGNKE